MRFLGIHAIDNFAPTLSSDIPRMATFSIFSNRLANHNRQSVGKFATNYFNLNTNNTQDYFLVQVYNSVGVKVFEEAF